MESIVGLLKPLIILYLINRYYDISVYSEIVLINLILSISSNIISLKIPSYIVKASNQNIGYENLINNLNSLFLQFALVFLMCEVIIVFIFNLEFYYLIVGLIIMTTLLMKPLIGIMMANDQLNHYGLFMMISKGLFITLFSFSIFLSYDIITIYLGLLFAENLVLYALFLSKTKNDVIIKYKKVDFKELSDFFTYVKSFFGINLLKSILKETDRLIITFVFDKVVLGIYDIGKKLFLPLKLIVSPFPKIFLKKASKKLLIDKNSMYLKGKILKSEILLSIFFFIYLTTIILNYKNLNEFLNFNSLDLLLVCGIGIAIFIQEMNWWSTIISTQISRKFAYINLGIKVIFTITIMPLFIFYFDLYGLVFSTLLNRIISYYYWRIYVLNSKRLHFS